MNLSTSRAACRGLATSSGTPYTPASLYAILPCESLQEPPFQDQQAQEQFLPLSGQHSELHVDSSYPPNHLPAIILNPSKIESESESRTRKTVYWRCLTTHRWQLVESVGLKRVWILLIKTISLLLGGKICYNHLRLALCLFYKTWIMFILDISESKTYFISMFCIIPVLCLNNNTWLVLEIILVTLLRLVKILWFVANYNIKI